MAVGPQATRVGHVLLAAAFADIAVIPGSGFVQHALGGTTPPISALCDVDPTLCDDTFFTMNLLTDDVQKVVAAPDVSMDTQSLAGSWFVLPFETVAFW